MSNDDNQAGFHTSVPAGRLDCLDGQRVDMLGVGINNVSGVTRALTDYSNPRSLGSRLRARRLAHILQLVNGVAERTGRVRVLDLGGTRTYWGLLTHDFLLSHNVTVTLLNLPGELAPIDDDVFRFVEGDACNAQRFEDNEFDIVHSNSVIEHVGDWNRMRMFAREVRKLAPSYFVQTPNFWFPIEPHFMCPFFHWLPEPVRARILTLTGLGHHGRAASVDDAVRVVQSARLLNRGMMASLFPDARIVTERVALLPKSLMAVRSAE